MAGGKKPPFADVGAVASGELLRGVQEDALEALLAQGRRAEYRQGEPIAHSDGSLCAYLIAQGMARLDRLARNGTIVTMAMLGAGEIYDHVPGAKDVESGGELRAAIDGTVVYVVPSHTLLHFMRARPVLLERAVAIEAKRVDAAHHRVMALASQSVPVRLAHLLCELTKRNDGGWISATQEDLAAMIGASREQVNRALKVFRSRDLIVSTPRRPGLHVPHPDRLVEQIDPDFA
jgi:CRP-like cAMP-binding protein